MISMISRKVFLAGSTFFERYLLLQRGQRWKGAVGESQNHAKIHHRQSQSLAEIVRELWGRILARQAKSLAANF